MSPYTLEVTQVMFKSKRSNKVSLTKVLFTMRILNQTVAKIALCAVLFAVIQPVTYAMWTYNDNNTITDGDWSLRVTLDTVSGVTEISITGVDQSGQGEVLDFTMPVSNGGQIVSIGGFSGNSVIKEVRLPDGLKKLADYCFQGCSSLTNIVPLLPSSVTHVGTLAFQNIPLTSDLVLGNSDTVTLGGSAFERTRIPSATLGSGVIEIPNYTFNECANLGQVTLSEGLTTIGEWAFHNCPALTNIVPLLPSSVTHVGTLAFQNVPLTGDLVLNNSDTVTLRGSAFERTGIRSATLGSGVIEIPSFTFNECANLGQLTLSEGLTTIRSYAFNNCSSLTNAAPLLPRTVTQIEVEAFRNTAIEGTLYIGHSGVMGLGPSLFENSHLSAVHLGEGVHSLTDHFLRGIPTLTELYFYGDIPTSFGINLFTGSPAYQIRFYIPRQNGSWDAFAMTNIQPLTPAETAAFQTAYPGENLPIGTWEPPQSSRQWVCLWAPPKDKLRTTTLILW